MEKRRKTGEKGRRGCCLVSFLAGLLSALCMLGIVILSCLILLVLAGGGSKESGSGAVGAAFVPVEGVPDAYVRWAVEYGDRYGVHPAMLLTLMELESGFDADAEGRLAVGLMQIIPVAFQQAQELLRADGEEDLASGYRELMDPETSIRYGARLVRYNRSLLPDGAPEDTQAAAYNAGPYAVRGWLSGGTVSRDGLHLIEEKIPYAETRNYVRKFRDRFAFYRKALAGTAQQTGDPAGGRATGRFLWPAPGTTVITSGVGPRWGTRHNGIDISSADAYGKPIVASDGGVVSDCNHSGWGGGYGLYVMIDHGNGYMTVYGHASRVLVETGQRVRRGQKIAEIGSTGDSTGPHLHFEIRKNGAILDPETLVHP